MPIVGTESKAVLGIGGGKTDRSRGVKRPPHGPGFDAKRMQDKNPAFCGLCHFGDPLNPGG